jgi:hypothetical protein
MKKLFTLTSILLLNYSYSNANPLNESLKSNNWPSKVQIPAAASATTESMRMNLYGFYPDSSTFVVDGTFTQYASDYSNVVDGNDARKMTNPGENISMIRGTTDLIIERRQTIADADTIFFRMWNMRKKTYRFQFIGRNMNHSGLSGFLEDSYLNTSTPLNLNDTTLINFMITNDAASSVQNRFRIIFKRMPLLLAIPITFTSVNAYQQNQQININWKTRNENNIKNYSIERSVDGVAFLELTSVHADNLSSASYQWADHFPAKENNYYRIRSTDIEGKIDYSNVVKVEASVNTPKNIEGIAGISLYPNPATINNLNLKMINQPAGNYEIRLMNSYGQILLLQSFSHSGGSNIQKINIGKTVPAGIYHLEIINPSKEKQLFNVVF